MSSSASNLSPKAGDAVIRDFDSGAETKRDADLLHYYGGDVVGESMSGAHREFIAHARQDVPALLAEVRALRAERDEALRLVAGYEGATREPGGPEALGLAVGIAGFRTERDRLRAALEEIDVAVEGYIDGAPDAAPAAKLANRVTEIVRKAVGK